MDNNNNLKNDTQIAGRVPAEYKKFIDSLWKDENGSVIAGESFPSALSKLIEAYKAQPLVAEELNFNDDLNKIKSSMEGIANIINGIKSKTSILIEEKINTANSKIELKDLALKDAEEEFYNVIFELKEEINSLKIENGLKEKELDETRVELTDAESIILKLDKEVKDKDISIEQLNIERTKLLSDVTEHTERTIELQSKINALLQLEDENSELRKELQSINTDKIALETTINIKDDNINYLKDNNEKINNDLSNTIIELASVKKELTDVNNKNYRVNAELTSVLSSLKELTVKNDVLTRDKNNAYVELSEYKEKTRNDISEIILKNKQELIDIKEKIKEDLIKKYDIKINKLKEEIFELKIKLKNS